MNSFIVVLILLAIVAWLLPLDMKQPKGKSKKFGEGLLTDTHNTDWSDYTSGDYRP